MEGHQVDVLAPSEHSWLGASHWCNGAEGRSHAGKQRKRRLTKFHGAIVKALDITQRPLNAIDHICVFDAAHAGDGMDGQ